MPSAGGRREHAGPVLSRRFRLDLIPWGAAPGTVPPAQMPSKETMSNALKTTVVLAGLAGLMLAVGSLFGQGGLVIGFVLAIATVGGSYWFSDRLALMSARATPVPRRRCRSTTPSCGTSPSGPACPCPAST